ncbi:TPA: cysteine desulfurase [Candidatus Acetothermia bacterium]|nr:cysteine desulfurase [Candidatus Acetothermia bacterium]HAZ30506.1 cysteine desulfurase [Candidatus Acetothermia bacterium]
MNPRIRDDFPILRRTVNGHSLVYLDSAATSQKPSAVIEAEAQFYRESYANVRRGAYHLAAEATDLYEGARAKVAAFIGARPDEVVFTRGTTEALNLAAWALGEAHIGQGDGILVTEMEHHANLLPWQETARRRGASLLAVAETPSGELDLNDFRRKLSPRTKIVALVHVSNVLGTVNPIPEIAAAARQVGAAVVVDAAQSVPHMPVNVGELGADLIAFSGHKMLGPTGIGVLWGRRELLEALPPLLTGGEMVREVWLDRAVWDDPPARFEGGTPPIAQAVALGAAVDYLHAIGMDEVRTHGQELTALALDGLLSQSHVTVYGPPDPATRGALVAFNLQGIHPHDVATLLDQEGIAIRAGHHCAQPLHRKLGVPATCRASFYVYNTAEEIEALLGALDRVWKALG